MSIAFFSDIHGNDIAFRACLSVMSDQGVREYYFVGDAVGYLPDEIAVLERLESLGACCQRGNHEAMLLSEDGIDPEKESLYGLLAVKERLKSTSWIEKLTRWPTSVSLTIGDKRFLLVHGSPASELFDYVYPDSDLSVFKDVPYDFVVMGNTHRPFVKKVGDVVFVNLGSIGLPRDSGNLASFGIYELESQQFRIVRVPIDVEKILIQYGGSLHEAISACFKRTPVDAVGSIADQPSPRI